VDVVRADAAGGGVDGGVGQHLRVALRFGLQVGYLRQQVADTGGNVPLSVTPLAPAASASR